MPFLTPEFVSLVIYEHWQIMVALSLFVLSFILGWTLTVSSHDYLLFQVDRKMQVLYAAARAISMIPAGELKDKFWIEWKKSVHDTMDALLTEIGVLIEVPLMLSPRCCFSRERTWRRLLQEESGATIPQHTLSCSFYPCLPHCHRTHLLFGTPRRSIRSICTLCNRSGSTLTWQGLGRHRACSHRKLNPPSLARQTRLCVSFPICPTLRQLMSLPRSMCTKW